MALPGSKLSFSYISSVAFELTYRKNQKRSAYWTWHIENMSIWSQHAFLQATLLSCVSTFYVRDTTHFAEPLSAVVSALIMPEQFVPYLSSPTAGRLAGHLRSTSMEAGDFRGSWFLLHLWYWLCVTALMLALLSILTIYPAFPCEMDLFSTAYCGYIRNTSP